MGSSNSTPKASPQDKAILDLKLQRDKLQQYQKRITYITNREREIAAHHLRLNDRPRALLALRRKKYQESLLQKTDQQLEQLQILCADVEFALVQKDVFFGLQRGTEVLKEIRKEMGGVEAVDKLMGENEDELAYQREIAEMLAGRMTLQEETEVEEELAALQRQAVPPSTLPQQSLDKLPQAPTTPLISSEYSQVAAHKDQEAEQLPA